MKNKQRRSKGDGSLYQDEKGIWHLTIDLGRHPITGKRLRKSVSGKSKKDVNEKRKEIERNINEYYEEKLKDDKTRLLLNSEDKSLKDIGVKSYTLRYLKKLEKSDLNRNTFNTYCFEANHMMRYFEDDVKIKDITKDTIQEFLNQLAEEGFSRSKNHQGKGLSARTIKGAKRMLDWVFDEAMEDEIISSNPMKNKFLMPNTKKARKKHKLNKNKIEIYSNEECKRILSILDNSPMFKPIILTLMQTGVRVSELLNIHLKDIDRTEGILNLDGALSREYEYDEEYNITKKIVSECGDGKNNGAYREIKLTPDLIKVIDEWIKYAGTIPAINKKYTELQEEALLFYNKNGELRNIDGLRRSIQNFLDRNDLSDIHFKFHCFRHTYGTQLTEKKIDAKTVADQLGHKDVTTTLRYYVFVNDEMKKNAGAAIEN